MTNPLLLQSVRQQLHQQQAAASSVSTNANFIANENEDTNTALELTMTMTGDVGDTVAAAAASTNNCRDLSLSPATKARGGIGIGIGIPRAKSAVTFGGATNVTTAASPSSSQTTSTSATTTTAAAAAAAAVARATALALGIPAMTSNRSKQRPFRSIINNDSTTPINNRQWVTREIAALEFLQMGIPMAREGSIVHEGWMRQHGLDQSKELGKKNEESAAERNNERKQEEEEDIIIPISPSLLPLQRYHNGPDPALTKQGRWWEKWIVGQPSQQQQQQQNQQKGVNVSRDSQIEDLEEPDEPQQQQQSPQQQQQQQLHPTQLPTAATIYAPGRRLEGDVATKVQIPLANTLPNHQGGPGLGGIGSSQHQKRQRQNSDVVSLQLTKHQSIARMAISKEWELRVAHGLEQHHHRNHPLQPQQQQHRHHNPAMMDGRMYMSAKESYPMMVFSLLRYEPKKEEALRRRQKLEERGGGGTQFFIMPSRDWRGISFRALLPVTTNKDENDDSSPIKSNNHRDRSSNDALDDRDGNGSSTEKRRNNANNSRLLFDRFAAKKIGSKDNFADIDTKEDGEDDGEYPRDTSNEEDMDMDIDIDRDSDEDEGMGDDTYVAGLLDDPGMVQGRHRNVMIGDRGTGPIVSSTIQFVKPKLLKADLNKQFRERFDGYEPPVSQRKFIRAKVVDGMYTLMDPTQEKGVEDDEGSNSKKNEDDEDDATDATTVVTSGTPTTASIGSQSNTPRSHRRRGSTSSMSISTVGGGGSIDGGTGEGGTETIRMPPSLTLSKIRSLKRQALAAAVRAKLEISTVALAIVYFERLCLDCRVDKSNRRLSFAACLLLAIKLNEADVGVLTNKVIPNPTSSKKSKASKRIQSLIRSSKKSSTMFASLLEFFTQEWNISLKHLFAAEWGVFAALQFRLKAKPSDVAFHFRRLMKTLGYDPRRYLGSQVYGYWQRALSEEEFRRQEWEARVESRRQRKEKKKLKQLRREIEEAADRREDDISNGGSIGEENDGEANRMETGNTVNEQSELPSRSPMNMTRRRRGLGDIFKTRIAVGSTTGGLPKRSASTERSWTRRRDNGDMPTTERFYMRRRGSGDTAPSSIKNNSASVSAVGMLRQRHRPPMLRPLSQSKSMLSLSGIDELSESKKSQIILDDLEEESDDVRGRQRAMSVDEEEGIVI